MLCLERAASICMLEGRHLLITPMLGSFHLWKFQLGGGGVGSNSLFLALERWICMQRCKFSAYALFLYQGILGEKFLRGIHEQEVVRLVEWGGRQFIA